MLLMKPECGEARALVMGQELAVGKDFSEEE